eukprot:gb/GFBE01015558.1/.p1 GENE.gb/GFBE01015558.1/~~gb/GFBE01015558.1/.p1  ORF type:complete len:263 (+),score=39.12 gb/GFBE01015558.1/:1-789(+)
MWSFGTGGRSHKCDAETNAKLEEAFQAFWCNSGAGKVQLDETWSLDLQRFCLVSSKSGSATMRGLQRRETSHDSPGAGMICVEWGHGEDNTRNLDSSRSSDGSLRSCSRSSSEASPGCVAYSSDISMMLEECYNKFMQGSGLKGALFTSTNGADYLVDFESMQQTRIATRRTRLVYRHAVADGIRGHPDAVLSPQEVSAQHICAIPRPLALTSWEQRAGSQPSQGKKEGRQTSSKPPAIRTRQAKQPHVSCWSCVDGLWKKC